MKREFSTSDARKFYDRFGAKQDLQAFYENTAIEDLLAHAGFETARAVFELGFGTGRLAERLLSRHLPRDASYAGVDISATMARLAEKRLTPWSGRVAVEVGDGTLCLDFRDRSFDRFVSLYVFDLLSPGDIRGVMAEAHRVLVPGGLLCLVSLTKGATAWGRITTRAWESIYRLRPRLVGGCRPIKLLDYIDPASWNREYRNAVTSFGITSEIVVASRRSS